jgi:hypothetical protein
MIGRCVDGRERRLRTPGPAPQGLWHCALRPPIEHCACAEPHSSSEGWGSFLPHCRRPLPERWGALWRRGGGGGEKWGPLGPLLGVARADLGGVRSASLNLVVPSTMPAMRAISSSMGFILATMRSNSWATSDLGGGGRGSEVQAIPESACLGWSVKERGEGPPCQGP